MNRPLIEEIPFRDTRQHGQPFGASIALHLAAVAALALLSTPATLRPTAPTYASTHLIEPPQTPVQAPQWRRHAAKLTLPPARNGRFLALPLPDAEQTPAPLPAPPQIAAEPGFNLPRPEPPAPRSVAVAIPAPPTLQPVGFASATRLLPTTRNVKPNMAGQFAQAGAATAPRPGPAPLVTGGFSSTRTAAPGPRTTSASNTLQGNSFGAVATSRLQARRQTEPSLAPRFGTAESSTTPQTGRPAAAAPAFRPVEILSKPKPAYTELARQRQLEGEVVLDVIFPASGPVRVVSVVRGLGAGLDEKAVEAARGILFRPAESENRAVDSPARIRILFQLAY